MEIVNVKASFTINQNHSLEENSESYLFYSARFVNILKCGDFTYSVMGKNNRYLNVTGCSSLERINEVVELFKEKSLISLIQNLKINSISFKFKMYIDSSKLLYIKSTPSDIFNVKIFPRFSGICFKHKKLKIAGNFFPNSKKNIGMGAKNKDEINNYIRDLKLIGFILIN